TAARSGPSSSPLPYTTLFRSAEDDVGAQRAHLGAEANGIVAQMAALHALQDHVVAGLQGQVQMRHQPAFARDRFHQLPVGLDGIDRKSTRLNSSHVKISYAVF